MKKSLALATLLSAAILAAPAYAATTAAEQQAINQDKNAIHQDMGAMQQSEKNESAAHGDANKQRLAIEEHRKAILASEEKIKQHKVLAQQYLKSGNKTDAASEQKIIATEEQSIATERKAMQVAQESIRRDRALFARDEQAVKHDNQDVTARQHDRKLQQDKAAVQSGNSTPISPSTTTSPQ